LTNFVAAALRVEKSDLFRLAQRRDAFGDLVDSLEDQLQGHRRYISHNDRRWVNARHECTTYEDFQFVEEGATPFPVFANFMHAYIDGSCVERAFGGIGIIYRHALLHVPQNFVRRIFLPLLDSRPRTNNRAEISSCIHSVSRAPRNTPLAIHTDSELVWDWFHWGRIAHRRDAYRSLENSDLWRRLDKVITAHQRSACVLMIKVRSHNGNPWNDEADRLAFFGSQQAMITANSTDELLV
jgi:ribonuclease HI